MDDKIPVIVVDFVIDKKRVTHISPTATTDKLIEKIAKLLSNGTKPENIWFVVGSHSVSYGDTTTLQDINIVWGSLIVPLLRVLGVSPLREPVKNKKSTLQPYPGYITITSAEEDVDAVTLIADPTEERAKMPCGHAIGTDSMTLLSRSVIFTDGLTQFNCPQCSKEWPYFLVRHVACLTGEEMRKFEHKLIENYLKKEQGIIQCPGCRSHCFRDTEDTIRMRCIVCRKTNRQKPDFCWYCLGAWKGVSSNKCGNPDCRGADARIETLATCPTKKIGEQELSSIRGCPKCGSLIEHKDRCKHMTCVCKHEFCFSCLKPKKDGKWQCTWNDYKCGLASRQTTLPGC